MWCEDRRGFRVVIFLQEEDGIRDRDVTGVQTCALPILLAGGRQHVHRGRVDSGDPVEIGRASCRERV